MVVFRLFTVIMPETVFKKSCHAASVLLSFTLPHVFHSSLYMSYLVLVIFLAQVFAFTLRREDVLTPHFSTL